MEVKIKKWGNSYGVLLKREELLRNHLQEGDTVEIDIKEKKKADLSPLFGLCKFKKSVDQMKKELKEEYYE